jgi:hypothetical protein
MMDAVPASRDTDIDNLYRLPLDEFTAARNALAKSAGKDAPAIRALTKPPAAAWAVNQLYWEDRRTWDALVDAAENLRRTHKAMLSGRGGDVRAAGKAHDEAVQDALKATLDLLERSGNPATDATRQAVVNTLRALPADDPPGRLTRVLQPGGFEMLAGLSFAKAATEGGGRKTQGGGRTAGPPKETKDTKEREPSRSKADAKALTRAREAAAAADRALKDVEQSVRRHEFEIARATRDEERGAKAVEQARAAVEAAKAELAGAERDHADAASRRKAAEQAAKKAQSAVAAARRQAEAAGAALKALNSD